jgi:hypothetical protein
VGWCWSPPVSTGNSQRPFGASPETRQPLALLAWRSGLPPRSVNPSRISPGEAPRVGAFREKRQELALLCGSAKGRPKYLRAWRFSRTTLVMTHEPSPISPPRTLLPPASCPLAPAPHPSPLNEWPAGRGPLLGGECRLGNASAMDPHAAFLPHASPDSLAPLPLSDIPHSSFLIPHPASLIHHASRFTPSPQSTRRSNQSAIPSPSPHRVARPFSPPVPSHPIPSPLIAIPSHPIPSHPVPFPHRRQLAAPSSQTPLAPGSRP